jgi:hypothetical protein
MLFKNLERALEQTKRPFCFEQRQPSYSQSLNKIKLFVDYAISFDYMADRHL